MNDNLYYVESVNVTDLKTGDSIIYYDCTEEVMAINHTKDDTTIQLHKYWIRVFPNTKKFIRLRKKEDYFYFIEYDRFKKYNVHKTCISSFNTKQMVDSIIEYGYYMGYYSDKERAMSWLLKKWSEDFNYAKTNFDNINNVRPEYK